MARWDGMVNHDPDGSAVDGVDGDAANSASDAVGAAESSERPAAASERPAESSRAPGDEQRRRPAEWIRRSFAASPRPLSAADANTRRACLGIAAVLSLLWFAHLARISHAQWVGSNVSYDFAIFHQPFHLIAHGHLNPYDSVFGVSYLRSHFELIMWLLAPTWWITRSGAMLLYIQDAALCACGFAVARWGAQMASASLAARERVHVAERVLRVMVVPLAGLLILMRSEKVSDSMREDFHFQAVSTFFLLMAATDLSMRRRRGFIWIGLALACGDVAGTYIAGLGLSALLVLSGRRIWGLVLILAGVVWVLVLSHLHFNYGTPQGSYAYLAGVSDPLVKVSLLSVALNMIAHPRRPWSMLHSRDARMWHHLAGTGSIGIFHPWALGVCGVVLAANNLALPDSFGVLAFQAVPVYFFSTAGLVFLIDLGIGATMRVPRAPLRALVLGAVCLLAIGVVARSLHWRTADERFADSYAVDAVAAGEINRVLPRIDDSDAVVSSFAVAGRLAGRKDITVLKFPGRPVLASAGRRTVVVLVESGNMGLPQRCLEQTAAVVAALPQAQVWSQKPGIQIYALTPEADVTFSVPQACAQ